MVRAMPVSGDLVDIRALAHLPHVHVAARAVVDGLHTGIHRSLRKGQSVYFADHRPYVSGDDMRNLDWKVLGRSDRLVIRRYEAESDLTCYLLLDGSASMAYQGQHSVVSKWRYAAILAATLAYLVIEQHDRIGWQILPDDDLATAAGASRPHFLAFCARLDEAVPQGEEPLSSQLRRFATQRLRRGLVICCSDALDQPEAIAEALDRLRHQGHHPALVWLLDDDEQTLQLGRLGDFIGLEGEAALRVDPRAVRRAYRAIVAEHEQALQRQCQRFAIPFIPCTSSDSPQVVLHRLLTAIQR